MELMELLGLRLQQPGFVDKMYDSKNAVELMLAPSKFVWAVQAVIYTPSMAPSSPSQAPSHTGW